MAQNTGQGYAVNVLPNVPAIDPRLFNIGSPIAAGLTSGIGNAAQLQQISEIAQAAPARRALAQIQLEESQARRQLLPFQIAAQRAKLLQPIETVVDNGIAEVPRYPLQTTTTEDGETVTERPAGNDVFATETVDIIDPSTGNVRRVTRNAKPLSTLEQQAAAAALADNREGILDIKQQAEDTRLFKEQSRAQLNSALAEAAQEKINNPGWQVVGRGVDGNGKLVYTQVKKDGSGERRTIPTDLLPVQQVSALDAFLVTMAGGRPAVGTSGTTVAAPVAGSGVDPDILAIHESLGGKPTAAVAVPSFGSAADAQAAARAGKIRPGQKIVVAGQAGTWQ